jgi:hypothetical protein
MARSFQRHEHVAGALDRPLIVLFEQDRSDEEEDGILVGVDADRRLISPLIMALFGGCASGRPCSTAPSPGT